MELICDGRIDTNGYLEDYDDRFDASKTRGIRLTLSADWLTINVLLSRPQSKALADKLNECLVTDCIEVLGLNKTGPTPGLP